MTCNAEGHRRECASISGDVPAALLLAFLAVQAFLACASVARGDEAQTGRAPGVFVYSNKSIEEFVKAQGFTCGKDTRIRLVTRRNGDGTRLQIWLNFLAIGAPQTVLVVSSRDSVQEVTGPAGQYVLGMNDKNEFAVRVDPDVDEYVFGNGMRCKRQSGGQSHSGLDPAGRYFFFGTPEGVEVVDVDKPTETLIRSKDYVKSIYSANGVIYLFTYPANGDSNENQYPIVLETYRKSGSTFELQEKHRIPRPSKWDSVVEIEDFDPESGRVLLRGYVDMPFSFLTARYLYNLKTEKTTRLGGLVGHAFFLKRDILEAAQK